LKESYEGRNMRFGIREFGMGAVATRSLCIRQACYHLVPPSRSSVII